MDIRQLRCFLAAAERLNLTRAAGDLFMTQSGVSYQIAALEEAVGVPLFLRTRRGLKLTEAGEHLACTFRDLVSRYEVALEEARCLGGSGVGHLTIGVLGGFEKKLLPGWLDAFARRHPGVEVRLAQHRLQSLARALEEGEVDLGFTLLLEGAVPAHLGSRVLFSDHSVVVMRPDHSLAGRARLSLAELKDQTFVAMDEELGAQALEWRRRLCRKRGFTMQVAQSYPSFATLFMAVEAGQGISIHAQQVVEENGSPRLHQVPLEDADCAVDFAAVWRRDITNPSLVRFLQTMGVVE
nr:LysR family transcriptional regulator [uncultured Holophaga sp.]